MAEEATERITVSATPERCFAVADDIERYPEWIAEIKEVTVHERDDEGRPSLVSFRAAAFGRSTTYTLAYDHREAPGSSGGGSPRATSPPGSTAATSSCRPGTAGPRSRTTSRSSSGCRSPGFIKMRAQSRIMATALRELRARVESSA